MNNRPNKPNRYEKFEFSGGGCPAGAYEDVYVTVPVAVRAFVDIGDVEIVCNGSPIITRNSYDVLGTPGAVSYFTVKQNLGVDIPMTFGAEADVGEGHVYFPSSADVEDDPVC